MVVCNTCKAHFHCSERFGKTLTSDVNYAQRYLSCIPSNSQAWSLQWSWATRVGRISTAHNASARLLRRIPKTLNDPYHDYLAFHMLGRCSGRVLNVYGALPLLGTIRHESTIKSSQRPPITILLTLHVTCSDVAVVVGNKCAAHCHCSELFGRILRSNVNYAQRSL